MKKIINGRFLTQGITGVQRFAHEIIRGLDNIVVGDGVKISLLGVKDLMMVKNGDNILIAIKSRTQDIKNNTESGKVTCKKSQ